MLVVRYRRFSMVARMRRSRGVIVIAGGMSGRRPQAMERAPRSTPRLDSLLAVSLRLMRDRRVSVEEREVAVGLAFGGGCDDRLDWQRCRGEGVLWCPVGEPEGDGAVVGLVDDVDRVDAQTSCVFGVPADGV